MLNGEMVYLRDAVQFLAPPARCPWVLRAVVLAVSFDVFLVFAVRMIWRAL
jgi:hypothetical protein